MSRGSAAVVVCESCELASGSVLIVAGGESFRVCVECAADGVACGRAEVRA